MWPVTGHFTLHWSKELGILSKVEKGNFLKKCFN